MKDMLDRNEISMIRDHSFPRATEFWAKARNLLIIAEFLHLRGIWLNSVPAGDELYFPIEIPVFEVFW